jgi:membrane protein DedA with SNARE-associated domain
MEGHIMIKIILAVAWSVILVLLTYLTIAVVSLNGHLHILIGIAVPVAMLGFITICERPLDK